MSSKDCHPEVLSAENISLIQGNRPWLKRVKGPKPQSLGDVRLVKSYCLSLDVAEPYNERFPEGCVEWDRREHAKFYSGNGTKEHLVSNRPP